MYIPILIAGLSITILPILAILLMWHGFKTIIQKNLKFLVTFSIGIFSVSLYMMLEEAIHLQASIGIIAVVALLGAISLEILQKLVPEAHHHHGSDESECCEHNHNTNNTHKINPRRILLGDAAHNIGDGIMLVPAYFISLYAGLAITIGIILHEVIQGISEFFILKEAGYSTKRALISNFIVSLSVFIGIGTSLIISTVTQYTHLLIAFASGGLIYIIFRDLLPHTIERIRHEKNTLAHLSLFILGVAIMLLSIYTLPDAH